MKKKRVQTTGSQRIIDAAKPKTIEVRGLKLNGPDDERCLGDKRYLKKGASRREKLSPFVHEYRGELFLLSGIMGRDLKHDGSRHKKEWPYLFSVEQDAMTCRLKILEILEDEPSIEHRWAA